MFGLLRVFDLFGVLMVWLKHSPIVNRRIISQNQILCALPKSVNKGAACPITLRNKQAT